MVRRFWYRLFLVCFGLWLVGLVFLAVLHPAKWISIGFITGGLALSAASMVLALWKTRCPHCKWRLWAALSRGIYDPDGVFVCPRCGKPVRLR